ncbi:keratin, type I cytoskeletal 19-like [Rhinophrynus dorsalis]
MTFRSRLDSLYFKTPQYHELGSRSRFDYRASLRELTCSNQKEILMNLNERLAAYLEKVCRLEESNKSLEQRIKEHYGKRPKTAHNFSQYEKIINNLESQIKKAKVDNMELWMNIENMKLTADKYKVKYEAELCVQHSIATDMKDLKTESSDLQMAKECIEMEMQVLNDELDHLKRNHQENKESLLDQYKCQVNVKVDNPQSSDLTKALEEMREQYTALAISCQKNTEAHVMLKYEEPIHKNRAETEYLQNKKREVAMLRRTLQGLETDVETLHNMKSALEVTLCETETSFTTQLQKIQETVSRKEDELAKLRGESKQLTSDSRILHYLTNLLEMEIRTYALLMDEEEIR